MARRRTEHDAFPAQGIRRRRRGSDTETEPGRVTPATTGGKPRETHVPRYPRTAPGELEKYEDPLAKLTDDEVNAECATMTGLQGDFLTDVALAFRLAMFWRRKGWNFQISWDWNVWATRAGQQPELIPEDKREGSWFAAFSRFNDENQHNWFSCGDCPENRTRWTRAIAIAAIRLWRATKDQTV